MQTLKMINEWLFQVFVLGALSAAVLWVGAHVSAGIAALKARRRRNAADPSRNGVNGATAPHFDSRGVAELPIWIVEIPRRSPDATPPSSTVPPGDKNPGSNP